MADNVHIVRINDTAVNIRANMEAFQSGVETTNDRYVFSDGTNITVCAAGWKYAISDAAVTYLDEWFKDIHLSGSLYLTDYIYGNGDDDTYIKRDADKWSIAAGGVTFLEITETTQDIITVNSGSADVDFRVNTLTDNSLFILGSTGYTGFGTNAPDCRIESAVENATTSTITDVLKLTHTSTGTPVNGFGVGITAEAEFGCGIGDIGALRWAWGSLPDATPDSYCSLYTTVAGTLTEEARLTAGNLDVADNLCAGMPLGTAQLNSSTYANLRLGERCQLFSPKNTWGTSADCYLAYNAYYNSGYKYIGADVAASIQMGYRLGISLNVAATGTANSALTWLPGYTLTDTRRHTFYMGDNAGAAAVYLKDSDNSSVWICDSDGNTDQDGTLDVTGAATLDSTLSVAGVIKQAGFDSFFPAFSMGSIINTGTKNSDYVCAEATTYGFIEAIFIGRVSDNAKINMLRYYGSFGLVSNALTDNNFALITKDGAENITMALSATGVNTIRLTVTNNGGETINYDVLSVRIIDLNAYAWSKV